MKGLTQGIKWLTQLVAIKALTLSALVLVHHVRRDVLPSNGVCNRTPAQQIEVGQDGSTWEKCV